MPIWKSSVDGARSRAISMLQTLEKSIKDCSDGEAAKSLHKHEREKDFDESTQEVQHLKQFVVVHQEAGAAEDTLVITYRQNNYVVRFSAEIVLVYGDLCVLKHSLFFYVKSFDLRWFNGSQRAVHVVRRLRRLRSLVQGESVKHKATSTLKCMQALSRVQSQVQSRRKKRK
ncbi:hypothetical protein L1987_08902 [Smallanthus sonchifolius]|uniref:Uncharacterized protein n=1 Tax=Smallanthus sonchifolius TaxID=185202 RepID=A0ACB9JNL8_9ASTR|nr:hypothetical protein L1987_08902 [Smallanthus sonchifolius]